jgi:hypothetical protein
MSVNTATATAIATTITMTITTNNCCDSDYEILKLMQYTFENLKLWTYYM